MAQPCRYGTAKPEQLNMSSLHGMARHGTAWTGQPAWHSIAPHGMAQCCRDGTAEPEQAVLRGAA